MKPSFLLFQKLFNEFFLKSITRKLNQSKSLAVKPTFANSPTEKQTFAKVLQGSILFLQNPSG